MNECHALKDRLLNVNKRVSKKPLNIPYNGELKWSTSNEKNEGLKCQISLGEKERA